MRGLRLGLSMTGAAAAEDFGTAIANISGGTSATSPGNGDYLLTKTAADGYDTADWNTVALPAAFDLRCRPNVTTGRYTRFGFSSLATGRTSANTGTASLHLFFDEFSKARLVDAANSVLWLNGSGNAEADFSNNEYWWLCRDVSGNVTILRGGTGTKASASAVASANTAAAGDYSGTRYFYASIYYQNETAHARVS